VFLLWQGACLVSDYLEAIYFQRRLKDLGKAQDLSASMRFDLASSPLSDDELDYVVDQFNPAEKRTGWGMSTVLQDLLSREPAAVPVEDLSTLQTNLKDQGYLPPDHPADGKWDPSSTSAFSRLERDTEDQVKSGHSWTAATLQQGIGVLANTIPSRVFQGVLGAAKGIVKQAPESFARGGAVGGAAMGAGIGASVGLVGGPLAPVTSTAGALVGGAIGGVAGFVADIVSDDEEEDQSGKAKVLDALTPFNSGEWTKPENFFEDLGFTASAASMISGVGGAGSGLAAGVGGIRASMAGGQTLGRALVTGGRSQPGWFVKLLNNAKGSTAVGATVGGYSGLRGGDDFGDVVEGALLGGAGGLLAHKAGLGRAATSVANKAGLAKIAATPLLQTVNKTYTGLSVGQMGARYAGGFGSGEKTTGVEKAIKEAPKLPDWVDFTAGMVVYPAKFSPVGLKDLSKAARAAMGNTNLAPYVHVARQRNPETGRVMSSGAARDWAKTNITPERDRYLREQYGIHRKTDELMGESKYTREQADYSQHYINLRSKVARDLNDEEAKFAAGEISDTPVQKEMLSYSYTDELDDTKGPMAFAGWMLKLDARGSGIEKMDAFVPALEKIQDLTTSARAGNLDFEILGTAPKRATPHLIAKKEIRSEIGFLKEQATKLKKRKTNDPNVKLKWDEEAKNLDARIGQLTEEMRAIKAPKPRKMEVTFVAAGKDYTTESDLLTLANDYDGLAGRLKATSAVRDSNPEAFVAAQDELNSFVLDLHSKGTVTTGWKDKGMVPGDPLKEGGFGFSAFLRDKAKYAARDVKLPDSEMSFLDNLGYKPVATGEDMRFMPKPNLLTNDVGDYTRRAAFFETIGASPIRHSDDSLRMLRRSHEEIEVADVLRKSGLDDKMNAPQAMGKLRGWLTEHNHGNGVITEGPTILHNVKGRAKRQFYKLDVRQMTPDNIVEAMDLDNPIYKIDDPYQIALDMYDAVKKGGAFGAEVSVKRLPDTLRGLGEAMKINGLPGFSDMMRTMEMRPSALGAVAGGVVGGGVGAEQGDSLVDTLENVAVGAGVGAVGMAALGKMLKVRKAYKLSDEMTLEKALKSKTKGTEFYLPEHLHNANMALRYSLSFTFDAGRHTEQAMIAQMKYGIYGGIRHKKHIMQRYGHKYPTADDAWAEATNVLDDAMGNNWMAIADDTDRRMFQRGLLGFSPREADASYAYIMSLPKSEGGLGFNKKQIKEAVQEIGRYGSGRTGAEKTANFVFFPFSFSKKFISSIGDWALQAPARAFIIQEGLRRYNGSKESEKFSEYWEQYMPLAEELSRINNLSFGLSPGRWFLDGMIDHKTSGAKVGQILASVLAPSGAATPVAQGAAKSVDAMVNLFTPVVLSGEDLDQGVEILDSYIPAVRDFQAFWQAGSDQYTAQREGGTPFYQWQEFTDKRRDMRSTYEEMAEALGYASLDGFLASDLGQTVKAELDMQELALTEELPTGAKMASEFTNSAILDERALADLAEDPTRSAAEEMILQVKQMETEAKEMGSMLGFSQEDMVAMVTPDIRRAALPFATDRRFQELWTRFMRNFGPISQKVAA
jgi:hypothetical protein